MEEEDKAKASETANEAGAEEPSTYEWSAHYDDEGRLYYYNSVTEESAWDPPADGKFNPPEETHDQAADATGDAGDAVAEKDVEQNEAGEEGAEGGEASAGTWVAYKDDEGREYYYNTETGETQWDRPDNVVDAPPEEENEATEGQPQTEERPDAEVEDADAGTSEPGPAAGESMDVDEKAPGDSTLSPTDQPPEEEEPEEVIDPAVKRVQDAEAALALTDSILEPQCWSNVTEVVASEGGNPQKAITALIDNYHGQTAICGLLGRWLAGLRTSSSSSATAPSDTPSQASADQIRETAQDVINRIAKERFTKETGDRILDLSKSEAKFLEEMMDSSRWRRLLIDLSATHKDSAVLVYCLRAISKKGHHREIAKRVNQSDHFAVFNAMLQSELTIIGNVAVSAGSDAASSIALDELVNDLRRVCSSTSYTYLYSIEALRVLQAKAKRLAENTNSNRFRRAIRKWQALSQSLESVMIDPSTTSSVAGSSSLFRKRRLDVALTVSELHQRQRRRRKTSNGNDISEDSNGSKTRKHLENSLLKFLKRYSVGMQVDDAAVDALLPTGVDLNATDGLGKLFIAHPLSIQAFLCYLYKPGATRVSSPVLRNKCGRLAAIAVLAAEKVARREGGQRDLSGAASSDEVALTRMIVQGSQICEQLESVGSFLVIVDEEKAGPAASPGEKLCALALQCASVAQGVVMWAREFTNGTEFSSTASFGTLSVSVLSLVRVISVRHPFTRRDALEVALSLAFQRQSNSDISYQTINAIKEQSLRLMVILLVKGEVASVLGSIARRLKQKGATEMDASLVRYFVGCILECVRPPVSLAFIESFGALLMAPKCADAVRSNYFAAAHRARLQKLLESFREVSTKANGNNGKEIALVSSLRSLYASDSKTAAS